MRKVSKSRWGSGVPTWVILFCKGHYVDPIQIIFLWEKRSKGYTPRWRGAKAASGADSEAGMEVGGGEATRRHRATEQGAHEAKKY